MSLIFLVNLEDWVPGQICDLQNCKFVLTRKSAAVLFSFKRIYNILSYVKQVIGADAANFLGEFLEKAWLPGWRSYFIGWTVGGNRTQIWKAGERNEQ